MNDLCSMIKQLEEAKRAVLFCLNNEGGLVNMHGLSHWAGVVERLREEIKQQL